MDPATSAVMVLLWCSPDMLFCRRPPTEAPDTIYSTASDCEGALRDRLATAKAAGRIAVGRCQATGKATATINWGISPSRELLTSLEAGQTSQPLRFRSTPVRQARRLDRRRGFEIHDGPRDLWHRQRRRNHCLRCRALELSRSCRSEPASRIVHRHVSALAGAEAAPYFQLMVDRQRFVAIVLALGCLAGSGADSLADSYSPQQIELAGKLGAAVALSRICSGTVPTTSVMRALEASGLTQQDVLGETAVRRAHAKPGRRGHVGQQFAEGTRRTAGRDRQVGLRQLPRQFRPERHSFAKHGLRRRPPRSATP